jgi:hypothetical protein
MRRISSLTAALAVGLLTLTGVSASAQEPFDLIAKHVTVVSKELPDTATSNSAGAVLNGVRGWRTYIENRSQAGVTNAAVTVDSGYNPSLFFWNGPVASFPATKSVSTLAAGQVYDAEQGLTSSIPVAFAAGYDSTRTVDTATIPVGGGQQTVTVTVTLRDQGYEASDILGQFNIIVDSELPGVTVASWIGPDNLNQGEELFTPTPPPGSVFHWQLLGDRPHRDKAYRFTAVLNVPNPYTAPITFRPHVGIDGALESRLSDVFGPTAQVADPTLDGGTAGRGGSTFAVAESNHTWTRIHDEAAGTIYAGTLSIPVQAWTLRGFYSPVEMGGVWNKVKGGSTVPMKFEVFTGSTELTDTSVIADFTQQRVTCGTGSAIGEPSKVNSTGGTSLRYDTATGQFIQNWKTPKTPGTCYRVTMTTADSSTLTALFTLK